MRCNPSWPGPSELFRPPPWFYRPPLPVRHSLPLPSKGPVLPQGAGRRVLVQACRALCAPPRSVALRIQWFFSGTGLLAQVLGPGSLGRRRRPWDIFRHEGIACRGRLRGGHLLRSCRGHFRWFGRRLDLGCLHGLRRNCRFRLDLFRNPLGRRRFHRFGDLFCNRSPVRHGPFGDLFVFSS